MASEILAIPEEYLPHVIKVIWAGVPMVLIPSDVKAMLHKWCQEMEEYLDE